LEGTFGAPRVESRKDPFSGAKVLCEVLCELFSLNVLWLYLRMYLCEVPSSDRAGDPFSGTRIQKIAPEIRLDRFFGTRYFARYFP